MLSVSHKEREPHAAGQTNHRTTAMASIIHATGSSFLAISMSVQSPSFNEMRQQMMDRMQSSASQMQATFFTKNSFRKRNPQGLTLGDSSCSQLVLIFENCLAVVEVTGRPVGEGHRLPADVDDLTRLRPEGSSLGGTSDRNLTVVGLVPVMLEHVIAPKLMGFRRDVRGHRPAAVLDMLVLLAAIGALGLGSVVHLLHCSNLSNEDDSAEGNMPPKKHNVKRLRHTARRTFRLTTGYGVRVQCLTVGRGAPYGREAEHCGSDLCLYDYGCAKRSAFFVLMGFAFFVFKKKGEQQVATLPFDLTTMTGCETIIANNFAIVRPVIVSLPNPKFSRDSAILTITKLVDWHHRHCNGVCQSSNDCQPGKDIFHVIPPFRSSVVFFGKHVYSPGNTR